MAFNSKLVMSTPQIPSNDQDPRQEGWPCGGAHLPGRVRSNQHASWQTCKKCGLRLAYTAKRGMQGEYRSLGPTPELVREAQLELQAIYTAVEMNEQIFQGKVMEIKGRQVVASRGAVKPVIEVKANTAEGKEIVESQLGYPSPKTKAKAKAKTAARPSTRTVTRSVSPTPSTAAPSTPLTMTTTRIIDEHEETIEEAAEELDLAGMVMVLPVLEHQE